MSRIVEVICEAWRTKNIKLLDTILAPLFTWYEGPFDEAITDKDELYEVWNNDLSKQENIEVDYEILCDDQDKCIARWSASYAKEGKTSALDGIFVIHKDPNGKLVQFRMWWVKK